MKKLHVIRHAGSGVKIAELWVDPSSTVYLPDRGCHWWIDGAYYVVIDVLTCPTYNTGDPINSATVFVL